jgi:sec-independent protein translocase protein TatA
LLSIPCYNLERTQVSRGNCAEEEDMFGQIGWPEGLMIVLILLLLFGASRLREIGGAVGGAIRDFRSAMSGADEEQGKEGISAAPCQAQTKSKARREKRRRLKGCRIRVVNSTA